MLDVSALNGFAGEKPARSAERYAAVDKLRAVQGFSARLIGLNCSA